MVFQEHVWLVLVEKVPVLDPESVEQLEARMPKHIWHDLVLELSIVIRDALGCSPDIKDILACALHHLFCIVHVVTKVEKVEPIHKVDPAYNLVCVKHEHYRNLYYSCSKAAQKWLSTSVLSCGLDCCFIELFNYFWNSFANSWHIPHEVLDFVVKLVKAVEFHALGVDQLHLLRCLLYWCLLIEVKDK